MLTILLLLLLLLLILFLIIIFLLLLLSSCQFPHGVRLMGIFNDPSEDATGLQIQIQGKPLHCLVCATTASGAAKPSSTRPSPLSSISTGPTRAASASSATPAATS